MSGSPPTVSSAPGGAGRNRKLLAGLAALALLVAGGVIVAIVGGGDSDSSGEGEILMEPVGAAVPDPFTESVALAEAAVEPVPLSSDAATSAPPATATGVPTTATGAPAAQVGLHQVRGSQPGLYGGTRRRASCDREQIIRFLESHPDKAAVWAGVQGISTSEIPSFVRGLTPVVLRQDTRVTNYGYRSGRATPRQAVLQAGHAVLVDELGVPRAKCSCGNPLSPPRPVKRKAHYAGNRWPKFSPTTLVVVIVHVPVKEFVLVDVSTGVPFVRKPATEGADDADVPEDLRCGLVPDAPACQTGTPDGGEQTPAGEGPPAVGEPQAIFKIDSIQGTMNGPSNPSAFSISSTARIVKIMTYHWNGAKGKTPGTIGLRASDGTMFGPWNATGRPGQGGVPNAYWWVEMDVLIPPGTYQVIDSDPASWAWASDTGGRGITNVFGYLS
ncbi:MAG: hypothetical protein HY775_04345 [Acidobacteria bacterium]|nr:hypothetical protein [Acidobacteriota bacterium]